MNSEIKAFLVKLASFDQKPGMDDCLESLQNGDSYPYDFARGNIDVAYEVGGEHAEYRRNLELKFEAERLLALIKD